MFTSRAEYRLILREDNADLRLTEVARNMGLVSDEHWQQFAKKREAVEKEQQRLSEMNIVPASKYAEAFSAKLDKKLSRSYKAADLLLRPEIDYDSLTEIIGAGEGITPAVAEQVEIQAKYSGYLDRQQNEIDKAKRHEATSITKISDYQQVRGLSTEACQKLNDHRPETIGQASRIPGITPAAISLLMVHVKKSS